MKCKQDIYEETIIDFMQGYHDEEKEIRMRAHIKECAKCQDVYHTWSNLLDTSTEVAPSSKVKKRVKKSIKRDQKRRSMKPTYVFLSLSVAAIVLFINFISSPTAIMDPTYNNQSLSMNQPFLVKDDTTIYEVIPKHEKNVKGYAWVNHNSNEMMLLVDGLHPVTINDYQAWLKTPDKLKDVGVFKIDGEKGQLYIKDKDINHLEHIVVSKEPRGGSDQPTDPSPFLIKLNTK